MEDAGGEGGVGAAARQDINDVLDTAGAAGRDDGDAQHLLEHRVLLAGVARLGTVMVHRGEKDLADSAFLGLPGPGEELPLRQAAAAVRRDAPYAVKAFGVDGADNELAAVAVGDVADEPGVGDCGAVDGYLVRSAVQKTRRIVKR